MATATIVPPASAPAPVSSPAPVSAPAASTPTPATPASPSTGVHRGDFDSAESFLEAKLKEVPAEEPAPNPEEPAPAVEEPNPAAEAAPEPEVKVEEPKTEPEPEETLELEDGVLLGPREFAKEINADANAKQFFDAHPEMRDKVFAALRRDSENRELRQYFPDVESAKAAIPKINNWENFSGLVGNATSKEGVGNFLSAWAQYEAEKGPDGKLVMENGSLKLSPQFNLILDTIRDNELTNLRAKAEREGNDRLVVALDAIREELTPHSQAQGELPEYLKKAEADIKAREDALNRQQREQQQAALQEQLTTVAERTTERTNKLIEPALAKAGITDKFRREAAEEKIGDLLIERLSNHDLYKNGRAAIQARVKGDDLQKQLVAHDMKYINQFIGPITAQVIRDATEGTLEAQTARDQKRAAQVDASRTEPRGTTTGTASQAPVDIKTLHARFRDEYAAAHDGEHMPAELLLHKVNEHNAHMQRTRRA